MDKEISEIPDNWIDVTPLDSFAPVYIVELNDKEKIQRENEVLAFELQQKIAIDKELAKESAMKKLAKLGLTPEEAKAVIGID